MYVLAAPWPAFWSLSAPPLCCQCNAHNMKKWLLNAATQLHFYFIICELYIHGNAICNACMPANNMSYDKYIDYVLAAHAYCTSSRINALHIYEAIYSAHTFLASLEHVCASVYSSAARAKHKHSNCNWCSYEQSKVPTRANSILSASRSAVECMHCCRFIGYVQSLEKSAIDKNFRFHP